jgi:hypothetical protein
MWAGEMAITTKARLRKLRADCSDWDQIIANFMAAGMSRRDVELSILKMVDVGLVRIEPRPSGPTAFVLTIPKSVPDEILVHVG